MRITITEALAEIQTVMKRLDKKRQFVADYVYRAARLRDPLESEGGSQGQIEHEIQSIDALEARQVRLRNAIAAVNAETSVTVAGETRTIADWLVWRRDIAPHRQQFYRLLRQRVHRAREEAHRQGAKVTEAQPESHNDIVVNLSERDLARRAEHLEQVLGELDGQLSLKNATTMIEVED